jgi:hypothetical protein
MRLSERTLRWIIREELRSSGDEPNLRFFNRVHARRERNEPERDPSEKGYPELPTVVSRAIVTIGNPTSDSVYVIAYDTAKLEAKVHGTDREDPWDRYERRYETSDYSGVIAGLHLKRTDEFGECNGAWQVGTAASNEKGWGTKVYLAAFEWLRHIASDRTSVSKPAEGLWKGLTGRGFVKPELFDDRLDPKTPPKSDDCKVFPARDPVLNSSYRLAGGVPSEIAQLMDAGDDHLRDLGSMRSQAEEELRSGYNSLFSNIYD